MNRFVWVIPTVKDVTGEHKQVPKRDLYWCWKFNLEKMKKKYTHTHRGEGEKQQKKEMLFKSSNGDQVNTVLVIPLLAISFQEKRHYEIHPASTCIWSNQGEDAPFTKVEAVVVTQTIWHFLPFSPFFWKHLQVKQAAYIALSTQSKPVGENHSIIHI